MQLLRTFLKKMNPNLSVLLSMPHWWLAVLWFLKHHFKNTFFLYSVKYPSAELRREQKITKSAEVSEPESYQLVSV